MLTLITFTFNAAANFALGLGVAYYIGATEFGTYALAVAAGSVLQTLLFEWLRLSTNRFYGEKQGHADPGLLATLNRSTGLLAILLSIAAVGLYLAGGGLGASALVAAMAPLVALSNGLFDYRAAVARAEFQSRRYAALVIVRNVAAIGLMLGAALVWCRADVVLFGLCLSALAAVAISARSFHAPSGGQAVPRAALLGQFARYAAPLIIANLMFLALMLIVRSGVALHHGLAESGRYSLALDIGLKLVATIGSGLDIVLFQLAVRAESENGPAAAQAQLGRNIAVLLAVLVPATLGIWLALPAFEAVFVGASYQGAFARSLTLLLPGLFAFALIQYAINPLFQIARRTTPVIVSATASLVVTAAVMLFVPGTDGSHGALATSAGFIAGLAVMIGLAARLAPVQMPWADIGRILIAGLVMTVALLPLRGQNPGVAELLLLAAGGAGLYGALALALDIAGLRGLVLARLRRPAPVA